jgi:hypothetical protein
MIYIKSLTAGIAAVLVAGILSILALGLYMYFASKSIGDGAIGWDPVSLNRPVPWVFAALIFAAGFIWEFRRAVK